MRGGGQVIEEETTRVDSLGREVSRGRTLSVRKEVLSSTSFFGVVCTSFKTVREKGHVNLQR